MPRQDFWVINMTFFIAQRRGDNNTFQLWEKEGRPHEFWDQSKALDAYEATVKMEGMNNVLLLQDTATIVEVTASISEDEGEN